MALNIAVFDTSGQEIETWFGRYRSLIVGDRHRDLFSLPCKIGKNSLKKLKIISNG